ncbi:MAG: FAD-dependent thymidylate synthase [Deltaproteobacteria bacterium]|nr:FAD-dependent thymidylate synthase [Deltaproteobacteria bacterium]
MLSLRSAPPKVTLTKWFSSPMDNAVATARTCYSSRVITDHDVKSNLALRDRIARSTFKAGHHTTLQHAHFQFAVEHVSRQALWSFFHAHPFYNSEQVSQRYVEVKGGRVLKPELSSWGPALNARWDAIVERQMRVYHELIELLSPTVERLYFDTFPARRRDRNKGEGEVDKRWQGSMQKRAQEVARYVLPIATHAHLYHTISALTLLRYHRLAASHDCPTEQRLVVDQMVQAVLALDGDFALVLEQPLELDATPDARALATVGRCGVDVAMTRELIQEFDAALEHRTSKLVSMTEQPERVLARALREALGVPRSRLPDEAAVRLLLDPAKNGALGNSLDLLTLGKASRALELVQLTFQRKISHAADSQAQRHRMTPGARPILWTQVVPGEADFVLPVIFEEPDAERARHVYENELRDVALDVAHFHDAGVPPEAWQYLLPNAVPVRYTETGSLLDQHHKWTTRLCFNAQEEIWRATLDEVEQVAQRAPVLMEHVLPPCGQRCRGGVTPYCPEGDRFCGQPVWQKARSEYLRVL